MSGDGRTDASDERIESRLALIERRQLVRRVLLGGLAGAVLAVTYGGLLYLNFEYGELARQFPQFLRSISDFTSPNFQDFSIFSKENGIGGFGAIGATLLHPGTILESLTETSTTTTMLGVAVQTIVIGFCGTVLGFPLALTFGVLGSERVTPFPFNFAFRGTMSTIRAIPALVWILIYVPLSGLTPVSAVLAIATDTVGNMGRLFTDELEEIDEGPIEAIRSTGADRAQVVSFGMLSQVLTSFIAWALYILEINVRIAISLGVVGAGGIGRYIEGQLGLLNFDKAAAGLLMVVFIVLSVELTSSRIRARLRPSEHQRKGLLDRLQGLLDADSWLGTNVGRDRR